MYFEIWQVDNIPKHEDILLETFISTYFKKKLKSLIYKTAFWQNRQVVAQQANILRSSTFE